MLLVAHNHTVVIV